MIVGRGATEFPFASDDVFNRRSVDGDQAKSEDPVGFGSDHLAGERPQIEDDTRADPSGRLDERFPIFAGSPQQQHLDCSTARALGTAQSSCPHPGLVDYNEVTGVEQFGQFPKRTVRHVPGIEQSSCVAGLGRLLSDRCFGEEIGEFGGLHSDAE